MSHDDADSCKMICCLLLLNTSQHVISLSLCICIYTVYRLASWFSRRHDTWHPQSLAETLEEQILHHLELAHLCHPTQSQEDDCYQHDYAFIRLAMHCLQACGSAHASLPTNTFLRKTNWRVEWSTQQLRRTFALLLHECVTLGESYKGSLRKMISGEKWSLSDVFLFRNHLL